MRKNRLSEGLIYPDIVMVPGFYAVGRRHEIIYGDFDTPSAVAKRFEKYMSGMPNVMNPNIYIGLTRCAEPDIPENRSHYFPSVQVSSLNNIPPGFIGNEFPSVLCARFRYIGEHSYHDIDWYRAQQMYEAIGNYFTDFDETYSSMRKELYFERVDISECSEKYCLMEWLTPIKKK